MKKITILLFLFLLCLVQGCTYYFDKTLEESEDGLRQNGWTVNTYAHSEVPIENDLSSIITANKNLFIDTYLHATIDDQEEGWLLIVTIKNNSTIIYNKILNSGLEYNVGYKSIYISVSKSENFMNAIPIGWKSSDII